MGCIRDMAAIGVYSEFLACELNGVVTSSALHCTSCRADASQRVGGRTREREEREERESRREGRKGKTQLRYVGERTYTKTGFKMDKPHGVRL